MKLHCGDSSLRGENRGATGGNLLYLSAGAAAPQSDRLRESRLRALGAQTSRRKRENSPRARGGGARCGGGQLSAHALGRNGAARLYRAGIRVPIRSSLDGRTLSGTGPRAQVPRSFAVFAGMAGGWTYDGIRDAFHRRGSACGEPNRPFERACGNSGRLPHRVGAGEPQALGHRDRESPGTNFFKTRNIDETEKGAPWGAPFFSSVFFARDLCKRAENYRRSCAVGRTSPSPRSR